VVRSLAFALLLLAGAPARGEPLLHPMFQDHAVLQRGKPIAVYGKAAPGSEVSVTLDSTRARARARADGSWRATLPPLPAGGPYELTAIDAAGASETAHDVLVGDVFLCGGQSNMQLPVRAANDLATELRAATDGQIRQLTVQTKDSVVPLATFATPVSWVPAAPDTVGAFSASCYFFARELKRSVNVPIGLVVAPWGGSRVRDWVSEAGLRKLGFYNDDLDLLARYRRDAADGQRGWGRKWETWWRSLGIAGEAPWSPSYDVSRWEVAPAALGPWALWKGSSPDGFTGQMWLRTEVTLSPEQADKRAVLDLGSVNEEDESWINGKDVGGTSWARQALHAIPAGVLRAGTNTIVTNIFCSWRNCGMSGPAESRAIRFSDGSAVPIAGPWRYQQMADNVTAPQLPWGPAHGVSVAYNGMIAPIGSYGFRAALWYQGESDVHYAPLYRATLGELLADWRAQFGRDLPFLIVQLPNFGPLVTRPVHSDIAEIREAQRLAATADPNSAYIVTIDVGDPQNIHPTNKQEVGRRLAAAAQRLIYGRHGVALGPRPAAASLTRHGIGVRFTDVNGALASFSGSPNAFELCGSDERTCRFVPAAIAGADRVLLTRPAAVPSPLRVRYCWGDSPICTLTDNSSLPASPFELQIRRDPAAGRASVVRIGRGS
jgi:sialate O-acetylesterase